MSAFTEADAELVTAAINDASGYAHADDSERWAPYVLRALADAGRLTPADAEVREEWTSGSGWRDATCAACGRSIRAWDAHDPRWGRALVLLDPDPTDDGDTVILDGKPTYVIREDVVGRYTLYRSHFFSCPNRLVVPGVAVDGTP